MVAHGEIFVGHGGDDAIYLRRASAYETHFPDRSGIENTTSTEPPSAAPVINDTSSFPEDEGRLQPEQRTFILLLSVLVVCLVGIVLRFTPYYRRRQREVAVAAASRRSATITSTPQPKKFDKKARLAHIEMHLVFKRVIVLGDSGHTGTEGRKTANCEGDGGEGEGNCKNRTFLRQESKHNLFISRGGGLEEEEEDPLDLSRTCPICICEYEEGESICWSNNDNCIHVFHSECGIAWLMKHSECPVCRADYLVQSSEEEELLDGEDSNHSNSGGECIAGIQEASTASETSRSDLGTPEDGLY